MNWHLLLPELALSGVVLLLLAEDLLPLRAKRDVLSLTAVLGMVVTAWLVWRQRAVTGDVAHGMFISDAFAVGLKWLFLGTSAVTLLIARELLLHQPKLQSAFVILILLATIGMMFLASVGDLLLLFVALELMTFSFYIMTAYLRTDTRSIEAGLKYLVLGAIASGCLLYGTSLLYGATSTTRIALLHQHVQAHGVTPLFACGSLLVLAGIGFKLSAVPFQLWVPDVYQGAPTAVTAFLAAGSKAAGFAVALRLAPLVFQPVLAARWMPLVAGIAALTMCYGNFVALAQTNVKRLLAYSSIGHAGYLLMGLAAGSPQATAALMFYLVAYALMTLAAFAVVQCVANATGSDDMTAFDGLSQRSPFLAAALFVALLSLAGVPPLVGFFGKWWLLLAAVERGLVWLVVVGAINVVISLYYYLLVVKRMYLHAPTSPARVPVSLPLTLAVSACLAGLVVFGIIQQPLLAFALRATRGL